MPSTELTEDCRVLSYLNPSEPSHGKLKRLLFFLLKSRHDHIIPKFHSSYTELFEGLENELTTKGKTAFRDASDQAAFNFLACALYGSSSSWPLCSLSTSLWLFRSSSSTPSISLHFFKANYQRLWVVFCLRQLSYV
jgi:hypothetical protein